MHLVFDLPVELFLRVVDYARQSRRDDKTLIRMYNEHQGLPLTETYDSLRLNIKYPMLIPMVHRHAKLWNELCGPNHCDAYFDLDRAVEEIMDTNHCLPHCHSISSIRDVDFSFAMTAAHYGWFECFKLCDLIPLTPQQIQCVWVCYLNAAMVWFYPRADKDQDDYVAGWAQIEWVLTHFIIPHEVTLSAKTLETSRTVARFLGTLYARTHDEEVKSWIVGMYDSYDAGHEKPIHRPTKEELAYM